MKSVVLLIIPAAVLFGLLGLFLTTSGTARKKGFLLLGVFFLLLAINYLDAFLLLEGHLENYPRLAFWEDPFALLYGPLIYLSSKKIQQQDNSNQLSVAAHFAPFVILESLVLYYHITTPAQDIRGLIGDLLNQALTPGAVLVPVLIFIHVFTYITLTWKSLTHFRSELKQFYSSFEISWTFDLLRIITVLFLLSFLVTFVQYFGSGAFFTISSSSLILISIILITRTLLKALQQPVFSLYSQKASRFDMAQNDRDALISTLKHTLENEHLYRNPDLNLKNLADKVDASERSVSHAINSAMSLNFYDLINHYRIREAEAILKTSDDPKLTVLEVMYRVGYNSKSSFNTQFKKKTGYTPTDFRQLHNPK